MGVGGVDRLQYAEQASFFFALGQSILSRENSASELQPLQWQLLRPQLPEDEVNLF
jgi:hypothetical protein